MRRPNRDTVKRILRRIGSRRPRPQTWHRALERFAYLVTVWTGSSWAFLLAALLTTAWLVSGPLFHFSDTWQLVMNTVSSIVTFLMVFLIQRSQNKDALTMQIKLNELIGAVRGASNRLINIEELTEDEIRALHERYQRLAAQVRRDRKFTESISIELKRTNGRGAPANPPTQDAAQPPQPSGVSARDKA